jgi:hypothetical protein
MIIAQVKCKCGRMVRFRTMPEAHDSKLECGWHICHGCGRKVALERRGGHGARIIGKCDGENRQVIVDLEE